MKIIIPMTGYGSRFVAAGYKALKPLIRVGGRPLLEWIVKGMYSEADEFLFVCREEHLRRIDGLESFLRGLAPKTDIFSVKDWVKKGPVFDVLRAEASIAGDAPAIINYCDFYMDWDWPSFAEALRRRGPAGAVPCYSGFHPHLLPEKNVYASCRVDSEDNLLEIREKFSFEEDKTKARHSPGIYYFGSGALLKTYCRKLVEEGPVLNGEYYASLPYNFMVRDGLSVWAPVVPCHFCQWGTPEDLEDYLFWTGVVRGWRE